VKVVEDGSDKKLAFDASKVAKVSEPEPVGAA